MKPRLWLTLVFGLKLIGSSNVNAVCFQQRCNATEVNRAVTAEGEELEDTFQTYPGQDGPNQIHEGETNVLIICKVAAARAAAISVLHDGSEQCFCQLNAGESSSMSYILATLLLPSPSAGDMVYCVAISSPSRINGTLSVNLTKSPPLTVQHPSDSIDIDSMPQPALPDQFSPDGPFQSLIVLTVNENHDSLTVCPNENINIQCSVYPESQAFSLSLTAEGRVHVVGVQNQSILSGNLTELDGWSIALTSSNLTFTATGSGPVNALEINHDRSTILVECNELGDQADSVMEPTLSSTSAARVYIDLMSLPDAPYNALNLTCTNKLCTVTLNSSYADEMNIQRFCVDSINEQCKGVVGCVESREIYNCSVNEELTNREISFKVHVLSICDVFGRPVYLNSTIETKQGDNSTTQNSIVTISVTLTTLLGLLGSIHVFGIIIVITGLVIRSRNNDRRNKERRGTTPHEFIVPTRPCQETDQGRRESSAFPHSEVVDKPFNPDQSVETANGSPTPNRFSKGPEEETHGQQIRPRDKHSTHQTTRKFQVNDLSSANKSCSSEMSYHHTTKPHTALEEGTRLVRDTLGLPPHEEQ